MAAAAYNDFAVKHEPMNMDDDDDTDGMEFERNLAAALESEKKAEAEAKKKASFTKGKGKKKAAAATTAAAVAKIEKEQKQARLRAVVARKPEVAEAAKITKIDPVIGQAIVEAVCDEEIRISEEQTVRRAWGRRSDKHSVVDSTLGVMKPAVLAEAQSEWIVVQCSGVKADELKAAIAAFKGKRGDHDDPALRSSRCTVEGVLKPFDIAKRGKPPVSVLPGRGDAQVEWCQWCGQVAYCSQACRDSHREHKWVCHMATAPVIDVARGAILRHPPVKIKDTINFTDRPVAFRGPMGNTIRDEHRPASTVPVTIDKNGIVRELEERR